MVFYLKYAYKLKFKQCHHCSTINSNLVIDITVIYIYRVNVELICSLCIPVNTMDLIRCLLSKIQELTVYM